MGQMVYVLMGLEGSSKKGKDWRPLGVVTNPDVAEEWYKYGKDVDWVPLELDDIKNINPEHMPSFQPRKLTPTEERTAELNKQMEATITRMQGVIDQQQKQLDKQQKLLDRFQRSKGIKASLLKIAEVPPKPAGFEDALHDAQEIADYIETYAIYPVDNEFVYEKFRGCHAVLKLVPIAELQEGGRDANQQSKKNEDKYLKQNLKTQPPAVVENGKVLDGNHRYRANKRRGLTAMWCYVVMEGDHASNDDSIGDQES